MSKKESNSSPPGVEFKPKPPTAPPSLYNICLAHMEPEPCAVCESYKAAGL